MTRKNLSSQPSRIIAIGASAGGLEALQDFLSHLENIDETSVIVAQHLSPTHKSMLVQLLSRETNFRVAEAVHEDELESKTVYITPPDKEILVDGNFILLRKPTSIIGPKPSVDVLFRSLAEQKNRSVIGIILSGTGTDGAGGVIALKKSGATVLVQEPSTAKYDGMPNSAIATGLVDVVLPPNKMGEEINFMSQNNGRTQIRMEEIRVDGDWDRDDNKDTMLRVFALLGKRTGTDFSNYKSATIARRLAKRLASLGMEDLEEYLRYIEKEPQEIDEMFKTILIGVTKFFRDEDAFLSLETSLSYMVNQKNNGESIRVWVPGCSTGEEVYSIAILLHKLLRDRTHTVHVQIFATDIDEKAIAFARKAVYSASSLEHLPKDIQDHYFVKKGQEYELVKTIRSMVLFSKHDVIKNPPFLKLDLISCRNLLIYFNTVLQQQVMPIFHYALNQDGFLFLGKSETIGAFTDLFSTVDGKNKIFRRLRGGNIHAIKLSSLRLGKSSPTIAVSPEPTDHSRMTIPEMVKETFYNTYENPYVVIDEEYNIQEVNGDVRLFLGLVQGSIQVNILKMVNPELQIELRSILSKVIRERQSIKSNIKKFELFGNVHFVRILAKPLLYSNSVRELFVVIFERLEIEGFLEKGNLLDDESIVNARILELEQELAATKEHLQTYIEEIETTNEELQSLNEEMQSTNEELQSSNEELETSNEELQSTNEEIQIAYTELKGIHEELERKELEIIESQANTNALLENKQQAFVLLDTEYKIVTFNEKSEELFLSLRNETIRAGNTIIDLLPAGHIESFLQEFSRAVQGESVNSEKIIEDIQGQSRYFTVNFTPVKVGKSNIKKISLAIMDVTELNLAVNEVNFKDKLIHSVFNSLSIGVCITDHKGFYFDMNDQYSKIYGYSKEELIGKHFSIVVPEESQETISNLHDRFIEGDEEILKEYQVIKKDGTRIDVSVSADLLKLTDGTRYKVTSVLDVTDMKRQKLQILQQNANLHEIAWIQSHEVRAPLSQIMGLIHLLQEKLVAENEIEAVIQKLHDSARELDRMIRNIAYRLEQDEKENDGI